MHAVPRPDTRLNRFVAIKILPPGKDSSDERRLRFMQEAQAASALSHPNIVTIYDVGTTDGADYIAMEFVTGKTLDASIRRDGMHIAELLRYAVQITDAMSCAHASGMIHRDLKPGNVMVTPEGQVKILDFGLAKLTDTPATTTSDETVSVRPKTAEGSVIGTAAYMSPEQAEGKTVDARSDIFSIGAILYEMATGRRAFTGNTPASTISSVLRDDPKPAAELRPELPVELNRLITRCLRKDPARRFQHVVDLKVALEELKDESESGRITDTTTTKPRQGGRMWMGAAMASLLCALLFVDWMQWGPKGNSEAAPTVVPLTAFAGLEDMPSLSPDGNQVAFTWTGEKDDNLDIYVKLIGPDPPLRLTTSPQQEVGAAWSPDGRSIAFVRIGDTPRYEIFLIPALGGSERKLGPAWMTPYERMLEWTPDGNWLYFSRKVEGQPGVGLAMLSMETGDVRTVTQPARPQTMHGAPAVSPDGHALAYLETEFRGVGTVRIVVQKLGDGYVPVGAPRQVGPLDAAVKGAIWARGGKELLYWAGRTTSRSSSFRVAVEGDVKPVAMSLPGRFQGAMSYSEKLKRLVYAEFSINSNLWRLDLDNLGKDSEKFISSTLREAFPQYSPDGKQIVFYSSRTGTQQIMLADADGNKQVQFTSAKALNNGTPRWSPDGQWITFDSNRQGFFQIYRMSAAGGVERNITNDQYPNITASTSRDGKSIYYASQRNGRFDIWKMASSGGAAQQVTQEGGTAPLESPDGRTLFFVKDTKGQLWRRPLEGGPDEMVLPSLYRYNYALTGKGVYYMKSSEDRMSASLEYLDFKTGAVKVLRKIGIPDLGLEVSPDGRYLLYAQRERMSSDLMLVDGFR